MTIPGRDESYQFGERFRVVESVNPRLIGKEGTCAGVQWGAAFTYVTLQLPNAEYVQFRRENLERLP